MHASKFKLGSERLPALKVCRGLGEIVAELQSW